MKNFSIKYLNKEYTYSLPSELEWSFFSDYFYKFANNCRSMGYHENQSVYNAVFNHCSVLLVDQSLLISKDYIDNTRILIGFWIAHYIHTNSNDELNSIEYILIDLNYILKKLKVDRKLFAKQINSEIKESVKSWIFTLISDKFQFKLKYQELEIINFNFKYEKYNLEILGSLIISVSCDNTIVATPYYFISDMENAESMYIDPVGVVFEVFNSKDEIIYGSEFTPFSELESDILSKIKIAIEDISSDQ